VFGHSKVGPGFVTFARRPAAASASNCPQTARLLRIQLPGAVNQVGKGSPIGADSQYQLLISSPVGISKRAPLSNEISW